MVVPGPPPDNDTARGALLRIVSNADRRPGLQRLKSFAAEGQFGFNKCLRDLQVASGRGVHKLLDAFKHLFLRNRQGHPTRFEIRNQTGYPSRRESVLVLHQPPTLCIRLDQ